jgi:hypothetical protein
MWFCLFHHMPFGHEGSATESEVAQWKLHQDPNPQLKDNIVVRSPGLGEVSSLFLLHLLPPALTPWKLNTPVLQELKADAASSEMLWFQIWEAMAELLKFQPNSRNIALGEMHHVLNTPNRYEHDLWILKSRRSGRLTACSRSDIFVPRRRRHPQVALPFLCLDSSHEANRSLGG